MQIEQFFDSFIRKESFFHNKQVLLSSYTPSEITYREEQIQEVAHILAPALRLEKPSNLFIYGKTGTGKTLSVKYVLNSMQEIALKNKVQLKFI